MLAYFIIIGLIILSIFCGPREPVCSADGDCDFPGDCAFYNQYLKFESKATAYSLNQIPKLGSINRCKVDLKFYTDWDSDDYSQYYHLLTSVDSIDFGDGTINNLYTSANFGEASYSHTYEPGTYTITINYSLERGPMCCDDHIIDCSKTFTINIPPCRIKSSIFKN